MSPSAPKGAVLFVKVLLAFCAVLVPLYVLAIFIYLAGTDALRTRLLEADLFRLQSAVKQLEQEYEHVATIQTEYVENYHLKRFAIASGIMTAYDRAQAILAIQDDLTLLCGASPLVADAIVDFPLARERISRRGVDAIPAGERAAPVPASAGPAFQPDRLELRTVYPPNYPRADVQFVLVIAFATGQIQDILAGSSLSPRGKSYLVDDEGKTLSARARDNGEESAIASVVRGAPAVPSRQARVSVGPVDSVITAVRADHFQGWAATVAPAGDILGPLTRYRTWFWALTVVTIVLGVLFAFWVSSAVRGPLARLMEGFRGVEAGDLKVHLPRSHKDEFGYLFDHFNAMVRSLDSTLQRCVEQESLARHAELAQLQAQISPHFLYNSIYHIYRMAKDEDFDAIEHYALHLGSYYEFITRGIDDDASLEEEARHALSYSEVQRIRFKGRIAVDLGDVPPKIVKLRVPRLVVQPLIENAYNHGLKDVPAGGVVRVRYHDGGGCASVTVEDNGQGMSTEEITRLNTLLRASGGAAGAALSGLANISRRLVIRFGAGAGVRVDHSSLGGFKVSLVIPLGEAA